MDSNTELAAELKAAIDYTAEKCANAPYVPVKAEAAQAILTALTQPAEQIADGAVGVTQRDREAAADAVKDYRGRKNNDWQQRIRDGKCDDGEMVQAFARHAQPDRALALDDDTLVEVMARAYAVRRGLDPDEQVDVFGNKTWSWYAKDCRFILTAIRALNGQGGGV